MTLQLGNTKDALDFYQKSLKIRQTLADADPKNARVQRDLSTSIERVATCYEKMSRTQDALAEYQ